MMFSLHKTKLWEYRPSFGGEYEDLIESTFPEPLWMMESWRPEYQEDQYQEDP